MHASLFCFLLFGLRNCAVSVGTLYVQYDRFHESHPPEKSSMFSISQNQSFFRIRSCSPILKRKLRSPELH